jgi:hypothetical protein
MLDMSVDFDGDELESFDLVVSVAFGVFEGCSALGVSEEEPHPTKPIIATETKAAAVRLLTCIVCLRAVVELVDR